MLGALESPEHDSEHPVAKQLMDLYESMGDTLALQYGGSPAHNKVKPVFSVNFLKICPFNENLVLIGGINYWDQPCMRAVVSLENESR